MSSSNNPVTLQTVYDASPLNADSQKQIVLASTKDLVLKGPGELHCLKNNIETLRFDDLDMEIEVETIVATTRADMGRFLITEIILMCETYDAPQDQPQFTMGYGGSNNNLVAESIYDVLGVHQYNRFYPINNSADSQPASTVPPNTQINLNIIDGINLGAMTCRVYIRGFYLGA